LECPQGFRFIENPESWLLAERESNGTLFFVAAEYGEVTLLIRRGIATEVINSPDGSHQLTPGDTFIDDREIIRFK
jgi:hypothetical protein